MTHYLGWYVLTHGYALDPAPSYIAFCFGSGMLRAVAVKAARRPLPWGGA